jgi:hypothetical protein
MRKLRPLNSKELLVLKRLEAKDLLLFTPFQLEYLKF